MKRVLGMGITLLGVIFLMNPGFTTEELLATSTYFFISYWPLILIFIGVYLQANVKKKRR